MGILGAATEGTKVRNGSGFQICRRSDPPDTTLTRVRGRPSALLGRGTTKDDRPDDRPCNPAGN